MTELPVIGGGRGDEGLINRPLQGRRTRASINADQYLPCSHCLKILTVNQWRRSWDDFRFAAARSAWKIQRKHIAKQRRSDTKSENNRHLTTKWNLRNGAEQARNIEAAWGQLLPGIRSGPSEPWIMHVKKREHGIRRSAPITSKKRITGPAEKNIRCLLKPNWEIIRSTTSTGHICFAPRWAKKKKRSNAHEIWTSKIEAVGTLEIANGSCPQGCCTLLNFIEPESEMEYEWYRF